MMDADFNWGPVLGMASILFWAVLYQLRRLRDVMSSLMKKRPDPGVTDWEAIREVESWLGR